MSLSFDELRRTNVTRGEQVFFPLKSWSLTDWGCAMAGEAGEACNVAKKIRRGDMRVDQPVTKQMLADELADVIIYADLMAARAGINLGEAVTAKFNEVSLKKLSDQFLGGADGPRQTGAGEFFRIPIQGGSYGQIKSVKGVYVRGTFFYGKNVSGEWMTASTGRISIRDIELISRETFMAHVDRRGFGDQAD